MLKLCISQLQLVIMDDNIMTDQAICILKEIMLNRVIDHWILRIREDSLCELKKKKYI